MPFSAQKSAERRRSRTRANRTIGRIWLVLIFFLLTVMTIANTTIEPMLGTMIPFFQAALIVSAVWNTILLAAIAFGHGWARYTLCTVLFSFSIAQILFIVNMLEQHPSLRGEPIHLVGIILAANLFSAAVLIFSSDVRQIAHHVID